MSIFTILKSSSPHSYNGYYKFITIISIIALLGAYSVEYILELPPCVLCVYQRYCYYLILILAIFGIAKVSGPKILGSIAIVLISAICISGYHAGVERGIFKVSDTCASQVDVTDNLSVSEVRNLLYNKPVASCERPALKIIGFSMSEWNLLLNLGLILILFKISKFKRGLNAKT